MSLGVGRLVVVGTGIQSVAHLSTQARAAIAAADIVFSQIPDALGLYHLRQLSAHVVPLNDLYDTAPDRAHAYVAMRERILTAVRAGQQVCAAFYGHPGVFVDPSHDALAQARAEGFEAVMLPGISAEDCLFADLGVDPAASGCTSFEATDFLFYRRRWDPAAALVLWQIGVVGDHRLNLGRPAPGALAALRDKLMTVYPGEHHVASYVAAMNVLQSPVIDWFPLAELDRAKTSGFATLYVPALTRREPDDEVLARLGLSLAQVLTGTED